MKTISGFGRRLCINGTAIRLRTTYASLLLLLWTLPAVVQAQFKYIAYSATNAITITGYYGPGGAVTIPSVIDGLPVKSIGEAAFYMQPAPLTSITIPSSVVNIDGLAFALCYGLGGVYFQGNAPSVEAPWSVFEVDNLATVYYLPGTTGWGPFFANRPTVLWNPQIEPGSVGVRINQFGFNVTGSSNLSVVIEASTNLANSTWYPVQTNTLNGKPFYFSDPQWTNYGSRFYRVTWP